MNIRDFGDSELGGSGRVTRAMPSFDVRLATPADEDAARRLAAEAFEALRAIYRPTAAAVAGAASLAPQAQRLVAVEDGRVIGTLRYCRDEDRLRLMGLAVAIDRRRRGVARRLIEHLAALAAEAGCRTLSLHTLRQTGNVPIFERLGFRVVCESLDELSESPDGTALTDVYMERDASSGVSTSSGA